MSGHVETRNTKAKNCTIAASAIEPRAQLPRLAAQPLSLSLTVLVLFRQQFLFEQSQLAIRLGSLLWPERGTHARTLTQRAKLRRWMRTEPKELRVRACARVTAPPRPPRPSHRLTWLRHRPPLPLTTPIARCD